MRLEAWHSSFLVIPSLLLLHLWIAPFTKVEESFNVQAAHDFLTYGLSYDNAAAKIEAFYDHVNFPGAVPRTFIGALALAGISNPLVQLFALELPAQQMLVRGVLGMLNAGALLSYTTGVRRAYGRNTALWFAALQASQFHITFYASRLLPNTFAFAMTTFALRFTLPEPNPALPPHKRTKLALYLMTIVTIIFRAEVALLLLGHCLLTLARSLDSLPRLFATIRTILLPSVLTATVAGLLLTVSIDTFIWRSERLLWPEAAAFLSNIFPKPGSQGASAWGTSPWHWYLTSALPRLAPSPLLIALPGFSLLPTSLRSQLVPLVFPSLVYLALYSVLPHKETRFLFPIIPTLNTALALIASCLTTTLKLPSLSRRLITLTLLLTTIATLLTSHLILLPLSALTYPGGHALSLLHSRAAAAATTSLAPQRELHVHLTNLALQTGVTHFLEHPPPRRPLVYLPGSADGSVPPLSTGQTRWMYDKSDNDTGAYLRSSFWARFDYLILEDAGVLPEGADERGGGGRVEFEVVGRVLGLGKPRLVRVGEEQRRTMADEDGAWTVLGLQEGYDGGDDGVAVLLRRMYGNNVLGRAAVAVYDGARALLTNRVAVRVTGGRWIDWQHETALVVMKRKLAPATVDEETTTGARAAAAR